LTLPSSCCCRRWNKLRENEEIIVNVLEERERGKKGKGRHWCGGDKKCYGGQPFIGGGVGGRDLCPRNLALLLYNKRNYCSRSVVFVPFSFRVVSWMAYHNIIILRRRSAAIVSGAAHGRVPTKVLKNERGLLLARNKVSSVSYILVPIIIIIIIFRDKYNLRKTVRTTMVWAYF